MIRVLRLASPALLSLALLGLLTSGCGMLDAKLEAQTVCFTLPDYPILGVPASGTLSTLVSYDLGSDLPILSEKGVSYTLVLKTMQLGVGEGSPAVDLGGIDDLTISPVAPAGTSLPEPTLVRYVKGADLHPTLLEAASSSGDDLAPYVSGGQVEFLATATGTLPASSWAADVKACFQLTVDVDYGKKL